MNYDKLKEDAERVVMDETAKRAITARLQSEKTKPKRAPVWRVLPAAAALLIAVGAGVILWHAGANPPTVTPYAPKPTIAATEANESAAPTAEQTETDANDISAPPTEPVNEEPAAEPFSEEPASEINPPMQQGSANESTEDTPANSVPAGEQGNMWMLRPGETAPPMPTLIRSYPGYEPVKYYAPTGSYVLSPALSAAIEKYGSDPMIHYYLRITVIDPDAPSRTWDEWEALYQREIDRMRTQDVNGEFTILRSKVWEETTAVEFALYLRDPAFLEHFPASPDYGYIIELFDEQTNVK